MVNWQSLYVDAQKWILEAGELIRKSLKQPIIVQQKTHHKDLVTQVDQEIELFLIEKITKAYPDHAILGEETNKVGLTNMNGTVWIIDPIDGTLNFIQQKRNFAISIGIYHDGIGIIGLIYNVVIDELYHCLTGQGAFLNQTRLQKLTDGNISDALIAMNSSWFIDNTMVDEKIVYQLAKDAAGIRVYGSAALQLAYVATGAIDAYLSTCLCPWDVAAGAILINEVGGYLTTFSGEKIEIFTNNPVLSARPSIHQTILEKYFS